MAESNRPGIRHAPGTGDGLEPNEGADADSSVSGGNSKITHALNASDDAEFNGPGNRGGLGSGEFREAEEEAHSDGLGAVGELKMWMLPKLTAQVLVVVLTLKRN